MSGYAVQMITVDIHDRPFRLRVLSDQQQFADPDGDAERAGISSAQWPLFGQLWPAGRQLAEAMHGFAVQGKRILELGCGIGLASLVLQQRGADVTATDVHPLAETFLAYNAALNGLPAVSYRRLDWSRPLPALGAFDLIIASDVLYERGQVERIAAVIAAYAAAEVDVVLVDAGRGFANPLARALLVHDLLPVRPATPVPGRLQTLHFRRQATPTI
jgi:predicted nicotinamide N-methyase